MQTMSDNFMKTVESSSVKISAKNKDLGANQLIKIPKNPYNTKNSNLLLKSAALVYSGGNKKSQKQ